MKSRCCFALYCYLLVGFCFLNFSNTVAQTPAVKVPAGAPTSTSTEDYKDHGWAKLDIINNKTPYSMLFYSEPRGLDTMLAEGCIVRIKALKTGGGNLYRVGKKADGVWRFYADIRDAKEAATQLVVSHKGKYITLNSETAGDLLLESDPKTGEVFFKSDKESDNTLWELVEDSRAGDTLETLYLKNKGTGGLLTAAFDASGSPDDAEINDLQMRVTSSLKEKPYLKITYAKTQGAAWGYNTGGSRNIADKLNERINPDNGVLNLPDKGWMATLSGISSAAAGIWGTRSAKISYVENGDVNNEKTITIKENKPLNITPNIENNPATPLKRRLEALLNRTQKLKGLTTSDIGRTGIGDYVYKIGPSSQWSKVAIELVVDVPTDDDQGAPKDTIAGGASRPLSIWAHRQPEFKGFGSYKIDGFGPEMVVTVNPLYSRGFAWIEESLPVPGQGTVVFRALSTGGDVHVCFSNDVAPQTVYRVAFGAAENTKTVIYKNEEVVQEISNEQNQNARIMPGMIEQMWVSLKQGFIMVGKGDPGTNIIMAWQDPKPAQNIERVGFSTYKSVVKFADVQKVADPIVVNPPQVAYVSYTTPISVGESATTYPLSPTDAGTVVFEAKGAKDASLVLSNDKKEGYRISFGADNNTATKIVKMSYEGGAVKEKELYKIDAGMLPLASLSADAFTKFWVSLYRGLIVIGNGEVGKNTFCVFVDSKAPKGISKIGFSGTASIQNLEVWPEVELGFDQAGSEYQKKQSFSAFKGVLRIISPYQYRVLQEGPQVRFRDKLTNAQWNMAGTPRPGGEYHFKIDVLESGEPQIQLLFDDPSKEIVKLEASVKMLEAMAESTFRISQNLAYATGPEIISSMSAILLSAGFGGVATGIRAGQMAEQSKLDELQGLANRYIFTERAERKEGGTAEISPKSESNKTDLKNVLNTILQLQFAEPAQLDYATKLWADALRLVTDFYVVDDKAVKRKLTEELQRIYKALSGLDLTPSTLPLFQTIINTLIDAYNNPYLTSVGDAEDEARRKDWYVWINDLSTRLMKDASLMANIGIDINFKGEYLWYPISFSTPGSGSVTFEAKAYNNIFVGFSENPYKVRNVPNRMYEIIFGMWDNKLTAIHRKSLGDSVAEFDHKKYPALSPNPAEYKKYWIIVDGGVISCGVGALGENKVFEWKDPYPMAPVKYVGFSNWLAGVSIRNVKVGFPVLKKVQPVISTKVTPATAVKKIATKPASTGNVAAVVQTPLKQITAQQKQVQQKPAVQKPVEQTPAVQAPVVQTPSSK